MASALGPRQDVVYDLETFPNWFRACFRHAWTRELWEFELSDRRDDLAELVGFLDRLRATPGCRGVGFNNQGFDYPVLHAVMVSRGLGVTARLLYDKATGIIRSGDRFGSTVRPWEVLWPQLDLFKIHHFDNHAKSAGLKQVQFAMRAPSVEDLPFEPGTVLTPAQMEEGSAYCRHDVDETLRFYELSADLIALRERLSERYERDFLNHNDTKIGKDFFVMRLEERSPGSCYVVVDGRREPRQTLRAGVPVGSLLLPCLYFEGEEMGRVHEWYRGLVVGADRPGVKALLQPGFEVSLGIGGIHGSLLGRTVRADAEHALVDLDVSGFYPDIAIQNGLYPEHLGPAFTEVYRDNVADRRRFPKGSAENQVMKLANNGVFGDTGNPYSCFYDQAYMLAVTVNGQLLLCMLAERLAAVASVELVQVNTDGLTLRCRRAALPEVHEVCAWWQAVTRMTLEEVRYGAVFVRDVNAYLAIDEAGAVKKRKGPFSHVVGYNLGAGELAWHQDHGALVVPRAAEAALLHGVPPARFVADHPDPFDFMLLAKAGRGARLELDDGTRLPGRTRYYVSRDGRPLFKVMPPDGVPGQFKRRNAVSDRDFYDVERQLPGGSATWDERIHTKNRSTYQERRTGLCVGYRVRECNRADSFRRDLVDDAYYSAQALQLVASVGSPAPLGGS